MTLSYKFLSVYMSLSVLSVLSKILQVTLVLLLHEYFYPLILILGLYYVGK